MAQVLPAVPDERRLPDAGEATRRTAVRVRALERRPHRPGLSGRLAASAWLVALGLHLLVIVTIVLGGRVAPMQRRDSVIDVDLIDAPLPVPLLPTPPRPIPPLQAHASGRLTAPPLQSPPAENPAAIERPAPRALGALPHPVFNDDGSAAVPDDLVERIDRANRPTGFIPLRVEPSPLLQPRRPLKVRPNHFAQYWNGTDGQPLSAAFWQHVSVVREFTAPWGGRYGCVWVLIVVACSDIPEKAWSPPQRWKPATELDER